MRVREFIGKQVDLKKLQSVSDEFCLPEALDTSDAYYTDDCMYTIAEIFLSDFICDTYDSTGHNAYSFKVIVDGNKILKITKIAHCHMCGGEGSDDLLGRFPYHSLEAEATDTLIYCIL